MRGRDRVDYQLACTHPPNLPGPQTWQYPGCLVAKEPTPSCGTVYTLGATIVGLAAGVVCSFAVAAKFRFNYDDSLDVVGVHFVGGVVGVSLIGLLATAVMTSGPQGLFYGGGFGPPTPKVCRDTCRAAVPAPQAEKARATGPAIT